MFITSKLSDIVAIFNWCFILFLAKSGTTVCCIHQIYIRNQGKNKWREGIRPKTPQKGTNLKLGFRFKKMEIEQFINETTYKHITLRF